MFNVALVANPPAAASRKDRRDTRWGTDAAPKMSGR
jgi:hypothetical protein